MAMERVCSVLQGFVRVCASVSVNAMCQLSAWYTLVCVRVVRATQMRAWVLGGVHVRLFEFSVLLWSVFAVFCKDVCEFVRACVSRQCVN